MRAVAEGTSRGLMGSGPGGAGVRELRVSMMGTFTVVDSPGAAPAGLLRKAQDLLALILLAPQRSVLREHAAEALWPDAGVEASKKAMRQALWQIHHATDASVPGSSRLVVTEGEALRVNPDRRLWVDAAVITEAARLAQATGADAIGEHELLRLRRAADLYRGPLLAGCYDEWCLAPRARLEDRCLTLLDTLSRAYERRDDLDAAIAWAERLLEVEPAHERSHRRLMRLHYRSGDRTRALRQLHQCRWVLQHELGVSPSAQTEALGDAIGADHVPEVLALDMVGGDVARARGRDVVVVRDAGGGRGAARIAVGAGRPTTEVAERPDRPMLEVAERPPAATSGSAGSSNGERRVAAAGVLREVGMSRDDAALPEHASGLVGDFVLLAPNGIPGVGSWRGAGDVGVGGGTPSGTGPAVDGSAAAAAAGAWSRAGGDAVGDVKRGVDRGSAAGGSVAAEGSAGGEPLSKTGHIDGVGPGEPAGVGDGEEGAVDVTAGVEAVAAAADLARDADPLVADAAGPVSGPVRAADAAGVVGTGGVEDAVGVVGAAGVDSSVSVVGAAGVEDAAGVVGAAGLGDSVALVGVGALEAFRAELAALRMSIDAIREQLHVQRPR